MVSNNIKGLIKKKGKTLKEISVVTGISFQQLSVIQNNKSSKISYETIGKLIQYFGCDFNTLFSLQSND